MECCDKIFTNKKAFSNHVRWCSGKVKYRDNTGYGGIHAWVRKRKSKPKFCEACGINLAIDLANKSGNYLRDIKDYDYLCRGCHKIKDYTIETKVKLSIASNYRLRNERGIFL